MAVAPAPSQPINNTLLYGIRPFDISRDLRPVAELIAEAFASELDGRGQSALREMRMLSYFGGMLGALDQGASEFSDVLSGFVWLENSRVVGNVTVQRGDKFGNRWQIANVAVAPHWRGRRISKRLMERALEHATECGGQWAVLQVYAANSIARHLYADLGFEEVAGASDLIAQRLAPLPTAAEPDDLVHWPASDWQRLYDLANAQLGSDAQWWRPLRRADFEVSPESRLGEWGARLIGRKEMHRLAIQESPRFEAALLVEAYRWRGTHRLQLYTRPSHYGLWDIALLEQGLALLQRFPHWPTRITLPQEQTDAIQWLHRQGFATEKTLLTMRKKLDDSAGR